MAIRVSNSPLSCYESCKRKYRLKYIEGVQPKKEKTFFILGRALHAAIEAWFMRLNYEHAIDKVYSEVDVTVLDQKEIDDYKVDKTIVIGIMNAYTVRYKEDLHRFKQFQTEKLLEFPICKGAIYTGKLDLLTRDKGGWWVYDHKTTTRIIDGYLQQARMSNQTLGYAYLAYKYLGEWPKGIVYNIIQKPGIRPQKSKGETLDQFCQRLFQEYVSPKDPDKDYFFREEILTNKNAVKEWLLETQQEVKELVQRHKHKKEDKYWRKSTARCFDYNSACEYLPICVSGGHVNKMLFKVEPQGVGV